MPNKKAMMNEKDIPAPVFVFRDKKVMSVQSFATWQALFHSKFQHITKN